MSESESKPDSPARDIYRDALQPAARELGRSLPTVATELGHGLQTISRAINVALTPLAVLVWGWDKIREHLIPALEKRLEKLRPEKITIPSALVAGPAIEALRYAGHEPTLRELYANLLATAMNAERAADAHPAFVEILRQLTPDEARVCSLFSKYPSWAFIDVRIRVTNPPGFRTHIRHLSRVGHHAGCALPHNSARYLENLQRLGLIEFREGEFLTQEGIYESLLSDPAVVEASAGRPDGDVVIDKGRIARTQFGEQFCKACVAEPHIEEAK